MPEQNKTLPVQMSAKIKLKDKVGKNFIKFDIEKYFGFMPKEMMILKVQGESNCFVIYAFHTDESLKKQIAREKELEKNTTKENREKGQGVAKREEEKA